jgi:hypothetical protein
MKIYIDISIFTDILAVGNVKGTIEVEAIPRIGDSISFLFPINKNVMPCSIKSFNSQIKVENVIFNPLPNAGGGVLLLLQDLKLDTLEDAIKVSKYLEEGFSLFFDEW